MSLLLPLRTLHTGARFALTRTPLSRARIPQRAGPLSPPLILAPCKSTLQSKPASPKPSALPRSKTSNRPSSKNPKDLRTPKYAAKPRKEDVEPKSEPDTEPDFWLIHLLSRILRPYNLLLLVGAYMGAIALDYFCFGFSDTLIEAMLWNFVFLLTIGIPRVLRHPIV